MPSTTHTVVDGTRQKPCGMCKKLFPASTEYFHRNKNSALGLNSYCKPCGRERAKAKWANGDSKKRAQQRIREWRAGNLSSGRCFHCKQPRIPNSDKYCLQHWLRTASKNATGTTVNWKYLLDMAERQEWRCSLTGEPLVPGINMSIDHKLPRSTHPELAKDLSNLHWVTLQVNMSKRAMTPEEFVSMCSVVHRHQSKQCVYTSNEELW